MLRDSLDSVRAAKAAYRQSRQVQMIAPISRRSTCEVVGVSRPDYNPADQSTRPMVPTRQGSQHVRADTRSISVIELNVTSLKVSLPFKAGALPDIDPDDPRPAFRN